jgi:hypothetical protein
MMESLVEALREGAAARGFITIGNAHVSGVSYANIGDAGREFLEDLAKAGVKVRASTTINPGCAEIAPERYGIDAATIGNQKRIISAFSKIGVDTTLSCTPYEESPPMPGEHIAWAESSAVIYANSMFGARSNRESGTSALASAITGKSPNYGMHITGNRAPDTRVEVDAGEIDEARAGALGYLLGSRLGASIPFISGIKWGASYKLKAMFAAASTAAAIPLMHVGAITAEAEWARRRAPGRTALRVGVREIEAMREEISCDSDEADCVLLGCPHLSLAEFDMVSRCIGNGRLVKPAFLFTSRRIRRLAKELGYVEKLERSGAEVIADSCILWSGLRSLGLSRPATNSAKACYYLRNSMGLKPKLCNLHDCIRA